VRVHLLGVRGSIPTPGCDFVNYGGNTSCLALAHDGAAPSLVLDAGTGIRGLGTTLDGAPFDGTILLSHLHWDHVEGLPFCTSIDRDDARTDLFLPAQADGTGAAETLGRMMSPPNFPIGPEGLRGAWTFSSLKAGAHEFEQFSVTATEVAHKGGTTFGYRISDGESAMATSPTTAPPSTARGRRGGVATRRTSWIWSKAWTYWSTTRCSLPMNSPREPPSGTRPSSMPLPWEPRPTWARCCCSTTAPAAPTRYSTRSPSAISTTPIPGSSWRSRGPRTTCQEGDPGAGDAQPASSLTVAMSSTGC